MGRRIRRHDFAGNETLSIPDVKASAIVGKYSAQELAAGVNLGNAVSGPVFDQSNKVLAAISQKNASLVHPRFRGVVMYQFNNADRLKDVGEIVAERRPRN